MKITRHKTLDNLFGGLCISGQSESHFLDVLNKYIKYKRKLMHLAFHTSIDNVVQ